MVLSGGGQLTRRQHLLSHDGRQLLVCMANAVRVYSTATAELLFEMHGHTDEVTDLCLDPTNPSQVYSSSRDGTIAQWDLTSGTQIQSWPVIGEPVESIAVPSSSAPAILTVSWRQAQAGRALAFDLTAGAARPSRVKLSRPRPVVAAAGGSLVATHDRHTILVWAPETFGTAPPMALHHTKAITCVAISPDGGKLAAGDATGRILIWHDVAATLATRAADLAAQKQRQRELASSGAENAASGGYETEDEAMDLVEPPAATVHWHAHAVGALTFSLDGKYLLSGGQEAVLVIWDVESGRRAYLPRLGGPLTGIAPCPSDPALYAVRQSDNTLRVINAATMTVEASVHGMRPLPRAHLEAGAPPPPLTVAPGSGLAVVTGPHVVLQWYDLTRDAHVDKLQLSARSVVSLTETDAAALGGVYGPPPEPAAVEVAFSRDGGAMATVETRPDPAGGGAVQHSLKFWDRAAPGEATYGSPYRLNTLADQPHRSAAGFGAVTALAFHPSEEVAATASDTGEFKVWVRQTVRGGKKDKENAQEKEGQAAKSAAAASLAASTWRCAAVGSHRAEPLTAAAFSSDGSVLALGAAAGGVSLWDARQTALLGVLPPAFAPGSAPAAAARVRRLQFVTGTPLLVAALAGGLAVYNLLAMRCEWAVQVEGVGALATDPSSPHWAVVLTALPPAGGSGAGSHGKKKGSAASGSGGAGAAGKDGAREQGVVVFKGAGEVPVGAWRLRRAGPPCGVAVAFAPGGTPLAAAATEAGICLPGCSPLVVLSGDREYAVARRAGAKADAAAEAPVGGTGAGLAAAAAEGPSGFQAIYGRSAKVDTAATGAVGDDHMENAGAARPAWAALFDAPSHALPAMGTLCPAFLEAMVIGGGAAEEA